MSVALLSCVLLLSQKLSLLEFHHAVQSLRGTEARLASQKALLDAKMATAASPPPPPPLPALPYEDDARSVGSTVITYPLLIYLWPDLSGIERHSWLKEMPFQNKGMVFYWIVMCVCVSCQDKTKEKTSRFDTLRHSLAGMIRSPKTMLGSSTSVRIIMLFVVQFMKHFLFFMRCVCFLYADVPSIFMWT